MILTYSLFELSQFIFIFTEFIGVTLANKIILVSCIQFYNTSSVCCIVLVGMQTRAATVERSVELPQKIKNGIVL